MSAVAAPADSGSAACTGLTSSSTAARRASAGMAVGPWLGARTIPRGRTASQGSRAAAADQIILYFCENPLVRPLTMGTGGTGGTAAATAPPGTPRPTGPAPVADLV